MSQTLTVDGMSCEHCQQSVEDALNALDDVTDVTVDLDGGSATVEGTASPDELVAAVEDAGYDASA